jgi:hypothetical protein
MAKAKAPMDIAALPQLVITPERPTPVDGNFKELEKVLTEWKAEMLKLELTEDNMELVELVKTTATQRRTLLTKIKSENNRIFFNQPKDLYSKRMDNIIKIVTDVEELADKLLDKREERRRDEITELLDIYRQQFQTKYQLHERFFSQIDYRKNYYNKGADEKKRKDDLEQQFKDLKKAQSAYEAGTLLITELCRKDRRLDLDRYLKLLETEDSAVVYGYVQQEIERLKKLDAEPDEPDEKPGGEAEPEAAEALPEADYAEAEEVSSGEAVVLGITNGIDFRTDFPGMEKAITIELIYPCDVGPVLTTLFERLRQHGVKIKVVKSPELVKDLPREKVS